MAKLYMYKTLSNGTCHLTTTQSKMASFNYYMACAKNSPYSFPLFIGYAIFKILSHHTQFIITNKTCSSLRYHAFGLGEYWIKKYSPSAPQCQLKYNSRGECVKIVDKGRLKLEQFYIAFAVLFGGYVLALLQFMRERFIRH